MKRTTFWGVGLLAFTFIVFGPRANAAEPRTYDIAVQSPEGASVRLHVREYGSGAPLVLLHGMGGSGYSFRHMIGPLARSHRVITIDLKGFGASEKPLDAAYRPIDQAHLVADFLRRRRLVGVTLAGHSYGGAVALLTTLILNQGERWRINRLVLLNTPAFPQELPRAQRLLTAPVLPYLALAIVPPLLNLRAALAAKHPAAPAATDTDAIAYAAPLYEAGGRHALIATTRAVAETDSLAYVPYYRTIRQPALLIWCRQDPTVPLVTGERLARAMPSARLAVLDRCLHMPPEEQPLETAALIASFARRH